MESRGGIESAPPFCDLTAAILNHVKHHSFQSDLIGNGRGAFQGIREKYATETLALMVVVDRNH